MAYRDDRVEAEASPSFIQSCKLLLAGLTSGLHTRLELFVTELEEERERIKRSFALLLIAVIALSHGFVLLNIFVGALFWEKGWIAAIGILALVYLGVGVAAVVALRQRILLHPGLFAATLAELGKDSDRLKATARE